VKQLLELPIDRAEQVGVDAQCVTGPK
jgi:hypothetical protein